MSKLALVIFAVLGICGLHQQNCRANEFLGQVSLKPRPARLSDLEMTWIRVSTSCGRYNSEAQLRDWVNRQNVAMPVRAILTLTENSFQTTLLPSTLCRLLKRSGGSIPGIHRTDLQPFYCRFPDPAFGPVVYDIKDQRMFLRLSPSSSPGTNNWGRRLSDLHIEMLGPILVLIDRRSNPWCKGSWWSYWVPAPLS